MRSSSLILFKFVQSVNFLNNTSYFIWIILWNSRKRLTWMRFLRNTERDWFPEKNRELMYSEQIADKNRWSKSGQKLPHYWALTRIMGRKMVFAPKLTKQNGQWRHLNLTILELFLARRKAKKSTMAAILALKWETSSSKHLNNTKLRTLKLHLRFLYIVGSCNSKPVKRLQQKLRWLPTDKNMEVENLGFKIANK